MAARLAEEWFAICGGCEVTILDIGEPLIDVLKQVEIVHMPVLMDHKFGFNFAMNRSSSPLFKKRAYKLEEDLNGRGSEYLHRLPNCCERGIVKRRSSHVVKTHDGAIPRQPFASLREGSDCTEGREVVKSQQGCKFSLSLEKFPSCNEACLV